MKIIAVAYNYPGYDHEPMAFLKSGLISSGDFIVAPRKATWAEAELAFMMGFHNSILSYGLANDVTTEIEGMDRHLAESKARMSFCPFRLIDWPDDPGDVTLKTFINGELVQEGNTGDRVLNDYSLIAWLSSCIGLDFGDIVLTGTPPHLGKTTIKAGDTVAVEAVGYGELSNIVMGIFRDLTT